MSYFDRGPKWIDLTKAVEHIAMALPIDLPSAKSELQRALMDGALKARFSRKPVKSPAGTTLYPPRIGNLIEPNVWGNAMIFLTDEGFITTPEATDDWGVGVSISDPTRRLAVQIDRHALLQLWPLSDVEVSQTRGIGVDTKPLVAVFKVASRDQIRSYLRDLYTEQLLTPPNVNEAFKRAEEHFNAVGKRAPRKIVREILAESEFSRVRLPAGSRKKR